MIGKNINQVSLQKITKKTTTIILIEKMVTKNPNQAGEIATESHGRTTIVTAVKTGDGGGIEVRIDTETKAVSGGMIETAVGIGTAALIGNGIETGLLSSTVLT